MKARTVFSTLLIGIALSAGPSPAQSPEKATESEAAKPARHIPQPPAKENRRKPLSGKELAAKLQERALKGIWWNQDNKLAKVPLSTEKRAEMDELLKDYLAKREVGAKGRKDDFADALEKGDWTAAEAAADQRADASRQETRDRLQVMIDVIQLLSPEERKALQENFPLLLRRDWMPQMTQRNRARGQLRRGQ